MLDYLTFIDVSKDDRFKNKITKSYEIRNRQTGGFLGFILWHAPWRKYCFYPEGETIFDSQCLLEITHKLNRMMVERKDK